MTIDEAVKTLEKLIWKGAEAWSTDGARATQLGIEALKRIRRQRRLSLPGEIELLSGETAEQ